MSIRSTEMCARHLILERAIFWLLIGLLSYITLYSIFGWKTGISFERKTFRNSLEKCPSREI